MRVQRELRKKFEKGTVSGMGELQWMDLSD